VGRFQLTQLGKFGVTLTADGAVLVIPGLKSALEARLGRAVAWSTVYRMLARHGWRKLAPDTRHPDGDPAAGEEWKKNFPPRWVRK